MTTERTSLRLALAASVCALLGGATAVRAQDPNADVARLQQLLRELTETSPAAWQARMQALEQEAKAAEERAKQLRAEAAQLLERANAAEAEAKQRREAMAKFAALEQAVRALPAAGAPATAKQPAVGHRRGAPQQVLARTCLLAVSTNPGGAARSRSHASPNC